MRLPSGRLVRGRGLRHPLPAGPEPTYGLYLLGKPPPPVAWKSDWLKWPDFWLPTDRVAARTTLAALLDLLGSERVEIADYGGRGRTGTALALLAVFDGVPGDEAVGYVRQHYDRHAVETPWQKRYVRRTSPR
jgi:hypothetical protein